MDETAATALITDMAKAARAASRVLATAPTAQKAQALRAAAAADPRRHSGNPRRQ
jgi:gamma-glutamyl phosphate reductase